MSTYALQKMEMCVFCLFIQDWHTEFSNIDTPRGRFMKKVEAKTLKEFYQAGNEDGLFEYGGADQIAMACCLHPSMVLEHMQCVASVCLHDSLTRGQMVPDSRSHKVRSARPEHRRTVVTGIDHNALGDLMKSGLMDTAEAHGVWRSLRKANQGSS